MKRIFTFFTVLFSLFTITATGDAMWAELSDTQLIEASDVIIIAEMVDRKQIIRDQVKLSIGILKVSEVLKGNKHQTEFLLVLPSPDAPRKSDDIFYKNGQKGMWFLRQYRPAGEPNLYLADNPQRFLPSKDAAGKINVFRNILE